MDEKQVAMFEGPAGKVTVVRYVVRVAYAKNGNARNPTPEYGWKLFHNGVFQGFWTKFKAAKEDAQNLAGAHS